MPGVISPRNEISKFLHFKNPQIFIPSGAGGGWRRGDGAMGKSVGIGKENKKKKKTYTFDIPLSKALILLPSPNFPSPTPRIYNDSKACASTRLPAPYTQSFVDHLEETEVLVDTGTVTGANLEDVEGGVEMKGKFKVGARDGGVRGEEGDV